MPLCRTYLCAFHWTLRGMVIPMPRLLRYCRILRLLYPLSAAIRPGKRLGLPLPRRLMAPRSISSSNTVASCCSPGVNSNTTGLPLPSHLTCILVEKPPLLRPKASSFGSVGFSGSPFLPRLHAGEHVPRSYRRSELTIGLRLWHRCLAVPEPVSSPRYPVWSSGRSEWPPFARGRIFQANLAREHRSCLSRAYHLGLYGGL